MTQAGYDTEHSQFIVKLFSEDISTEIITSSSKGPYFGLLAEGYKGPFYNTEAKQLIFIKTRPLFPMIRYMSIEELKAGQIENI